MALRHVARRGGAVAVLADPTRHCDRRFLLEQLAVADLFGEQAVMHTGCQPSLLQRDIHDWGGTNVAGWRGFLVEGRLVGMVRNAVGVV